MLAIGGCHLPDVVSVLAKDHGHETGKGTAADEIATAIVLGFDLPGQEVGSTDRIERDSLDLDQV
jgi:hypothetical protein